jgi:hypothetical protein
MDPHGDTSRKERAFGLDWGSSGVSKAVGTVEEPWSA